MAKSMRFNVSCDLLVPVLVSIEAESWENAEEKLYDLKKNYLLSYANKEEDAIGILEGSVDICAE